MLFGSFFRIGGFALNAGLVFLLSPDEPKLPWHGSAPASAWAETRGHIWEGLRRVEKDLEKSRRRANREN